MERKKGVLLLADVIDYTPQIEEFGPDKTRIFDMAFETAVKTMAIRYKGIFIKRMGDAVLLYFAEEINALEFAIRLRQASRERELDCSEFTCNLRIVAHFGKFNFLFNQGVCTDVSGPDVIMVFRIEKHAQKHEILVTQYLLQLIDGELKNKAIQVELVEEEVLKGFKRKTVFYRLQFPKKEIKTRINLLVEKTEELERNTRKIPVFGNIYPAMSMEDNFVNLDMTSDEETEAEKLEKNVFHTKKIVQCINSIELRESKLFQRERLPLKVSELYQRFNRGIIFGLPGSGKTTILKYFAFRELKKNKTTLDQEVKRRVLFIECRNIMSYSEWFKQHPETVSSGKAEVEFSIEFILNYLVHSFLFDRHSPSADSWVQKTENLIHHAYYRGRLSVLIDGLDEASSKEVKDNLITIMKHLFSHSKEGERQTNRFYLAARYSERERSMSENRTGSLKPVFDVRSLDMEQLRQMAEYFYRGEPTLYREFDQMVWKEEIAAKVGGTPLTALLVIVYFECFKKFDTRYNGKGTVGKGTVKKNFKYIEKSQILYYYC